MLTVVMFTTAHFHKSPLVLPTMLNKPEFTDDELALLHLLLSQDMESSRVELHHTAGLPYREYIKRRMEQGQALLEKMDSVLPIQRAAGAD
jgi:hypothetical protein